MSESYANLPCEDVIDAAIACIKSIEESREERKREILSKTSPGIKIFGFNILATTEEDLKDSWDYRLVNASFMNQEKVANRLKGLAIAKKSTGGEFITVSAKDFEKIEPYYKGE